MTVLFDKTEVTPDDGEQTKPNYHCIADSDSMLQETDDLVTDDEADAKNHGPVIHFVSLSFNSLWHHYRQRLPVLISHRIII